MNNNPTELNEISLTWKADQLMMIPRNQQSPWSHLPFSSRSFWGINHFLCILKFLTCRYLTACPQSHERLFPRSFWTANHGSTVTQFQILLNQPMWIIGSDIATDQYEWDRYDYYYHHPLVPQTIHSCSFLFTLSNRNYHIGNESKNRWNLEGVGWFSWSVWITSSRF